MPLQAAFRHKPDAKEALCPIKRTLASWSYRRFLIILRMIPYMRLVQERLVFFFIFKSYQRKINYILTKIHFFSLFDQVKL